MFGTFVKGHLQQFSPIGSSQHQDLPAYEFRRIFEWGVAVLQPLRDLTFAFPGGYAADLPAEIDAFGHAVDRDYGPCSIKESRADGRSGAQHVDDHHDGISHFIQMEQGGGKTGM